MTIKEGETIPSGEFGYIPYTDEIASPEACGVPGKVKTDSWKGKKVVIFALPGAFTPTCSANHAPPYVQKNDELKSKGVDEVYCLVSNDLFVASAFQRVMKAGGKFECISDPSLEWLKKVGLTQDLAKVGFGERPARFAMVVDDLKVTYLGVETGPGVGPSGVDAVLAKL